MSGYKHLLIDFSACDSPIETFFYRELQKLIVQENTILRQVECRTEVGTFRPDFIVSGNRVLGFECDGKEFHEDTKRDAFRDKALIQAGWADRIYRIRGRDIHFHIHDALDLIAAEEPWLFSGRGMDIIKARATRDYEHSDEIIMSKDFPFAAVRTYQIENDEDGGDFWSDEDLISFKQPTVVCWTSV